jgi:hypothetical protein
MIQINELINRFVKFFNSVYLFYFLSLLKRYGIGLSFIQSKFISLKSEFYYILYMLIEYRF